MNQSRSDRAFEIINGLLLSVVLLLVLYPLYFVLIASISNPTLVMTGEVFLYPREVTFEAYEKVFEYPMLMTGYANTILYTLAGTVVNLFFTLTAAYALSRKDLPGNGFFTLFCAITMFFNGGLIPTFLVVKSLGLVNTRWIMILLGATGMWNIVITRTFFSSIPGEIQEAARIDGCSDIGIFVRIILPLSSAIIAVIAMFCAVGHWNSYFNALVYLQDYKLVPLQIVLRDILLLNDITKMNMSIGEMESLAKRAHLAQQLKYALIVFASVPVIVMYPFFQRYFVKGVMVGAIKG